MYDDDICHDQIYLEDVIFHIIFNEIDILTNDHELWIFHDH